MEPIFLIICIVSIFFNFLLGYAVYRLYNRTFAIERMHPYSPNAKQNRGLEFAADNHDCFLFLIDAKSGAILPVERQSTLQDNVDAVYVKQYKKDIS